MSKNLDSSVAIQCCLLFLEGGVANALSLNFVHIYSTSSLFDILVISSYQNIKKNSVDLVQTKH